MSYFDVRQKEIVKKIAVEMNLPEEVVMFAYHSKWEFIKKTIEALPLMEDITEDQYKELRTSFNLPKLGKLYTNWGQISRLKKRIKTIKENKDVTNKKD